MAKGWRIRLAARAEADFLHILETTVELFGPLQANIYEDHLLAALAELENGPDILHSLARPELGTDVRTYHIGRKGAAARHLICYRSGGGDVIEVLRILHDAMDLPRHLPRD